MHLVQASPVRRGLVGGEGLRRLLAVVLCVLDQRWVLRLTVTAAVALHLRNHESCRALQGRAFDALARIWDTLAECKEGSESNKAKRSHCAVAEGIRAKISL